MGLVYLHKKNNSMKILKCIGVLLFIGLCLSCEDDNNNDLIQAQEAENLNLMLEEIELIAASHNCDDPSEWRYTSYGTKACGGYVGYFAFHKTIDMDLFFGKIEAHRLAEDLYNIKWGIISDCAVTPKPNGVICENGSPILVY